jgi:hypothetical protein
MEVRINKEVREYQESLFFGLNLRQFIFSVLAVLVAVGLYFALRDVVGQEEVGWMCILGAAPFAACGFFRYHGMNAERFVAVWIYSEFIYPRKLVFRADNIYAQTLKDSALLKEEIAHD